MYKIKYNFLLKTIGDRNNHYLKIYAAYAHKTSLKCDVYNQSGKLFSADYFPNKNEIVIESLDEQTKQYLELNGFTLQEI
ncbi:hypothetical protein Q7472_05530 [Glaesserella parasuis]|uniref:hypothetical protein n=1 Tax=Glaesserella parasuis TaxID=738 RepID=UPI0013667222|nr:hypothetical protein [Glaesserella parasuis]MDG6354829.1 hypothetical protein [Glaesserella parasuis]MDG6819650.1 hypothetical protein [Glaesserella parasuis]MDG6843384.1 hypothetical protein [Glaesserella parasuis]MDO9673886.1 hypothetical protein [Glaesserella parasuis]MDO9985312.1 hypothetical protein [Glaesserella parasuis]